MVFLFVVVDGLCKFIHELIVMVSFYWWYYSFGKEKLILICFLFFPLCFSGGFSVCVFELHVVDFPWIQWSKLRETRKGSVRKVGLRKVALPYLLQSWVQTQLFTSLFGYIFYICRIVLTCWFMLFYCMLKIKVCLCWFVVAHDYHNHSNFSLKLACVNIVFSLNCNLHASKTPFFH